MKCAEFRIFTHWNRIQDETVIMLTRCGVTARASHGSTFGVIGLNVTVATELNR